MHRIVLMTGLALSMRAGSVQGVVLEHISGRALARTVVRLEPVTKSNSPAGSALATRAERSGYFVFPAVAPGLYLVIAEREGYFPAAFGQRLPTGRGTPVTVTPDSNLFADLRLRHKGAITGRVLDENGVGRPRTTVVAYRAQLPLRSAGTAISDDRGVYRIHGLLPGRYWVRSGPQTLDDGSGWLPTYGPQGRDVREARVHRVIVDSDTTDADINPEPGALFRVGGTITCDSAGPVTVVLSSETGRRQAQTVCNGRYQFDGLAPAYYEVFARLQEGTAASFIELYAGGDTLGANVQILQLPTVDIEVRMAGTNAPADIPVVLLGRRQDLSETEVAREIRRPRATLAPGHWEFRAEVAEGYYVDSIANMRASPRRLRKQERPADWYDAFIESPSSPARIRVSISDRTAEVSGTVRTDGQAVPGVPVFLAPKEEATRRSLGGSRQMLTDTEGRFRFASLPPGDYRILASFDVYEIDEELLEVSRARVVRAEASQVAPVELGVWQAP